MKFRLTTILLFGLVISCTRSTDTKKKLKESNNKTTQTNNNLEEASGEQQNDTLTIIDSDLTIDPFGFGNNPLSTLTSVDNFNLDFQIFKNRHVENEIDTTFQIKIQVDHFEVYKTASENWLTEAKVLSNNFQTSHGVKIGMTKLEVKEKLNLTKDVPDFIRLQSLEVPQWIDLKFNNDTLELIKFKGYVD